MPETKLRRKNRTVSFSLNSLTASTDTILLGDMAGGALQVATDTVVQPLSTHPYVQVTMTVSSVSQHTHLLGCGTVLGSCVSYVHPTTKEKTVESIPCLHVLASSVTMELGKTIVSLSDILSKPMKKKQVQLLVSPIKINCQQSMMHIRRMFHLLLRKQILFKQIICQP